MVAKKHAVHPSQPIRCSNQEAVANQHLQKNQKLIESQLTNTEIGCEENLPAEPGGI